MPRFIILHRRFIILRHSIKMCKIRSQNSRSSWRKRSTALMSLRINSPRRILFFNGRHPRLNCIFDCISLFLINTLSLCYIIRSHITCDCASYHVSISLQLWGLLTYAVTCNKSVELSTLTKYYYWLDSGVDWSGRFLVWRKLK